MKMLASAVALIAALCLPGSLAASAETQASPTAASKPVPDWYVRGVAAALLDLTPGVPAETMRLPRISDALSAIAKGDVLGTIAKGGAPKVDKLAITQKLMDQLQEGGDWDRSAVATAIIAINSINSEQRKSVVETLVKLAVTPKWNDSDMKVKSVATAALGATNPSDRTQRKTVVETLSKLRTDLGFEGTTAALGAIESGDPEQRKTALETAIKLLADRVDLVAQRPAASLGATNPSGPEQLKTVLETLVRQFTVSGSPYAQNAAVQLSKINPNDPEALKAIVQAVLDAAQNGDSDPATDPSVQASAATELGAINSSDPGQRKTIVETLSKLTASPYPDVRASADAALGAIHPSDPEQRKALHEALIKLAADTEPQAQASAALLATGPLEADQVVHLLVQLDQDRAQATQRWRAMGWAFNGDLPLENEGAILMTFAGRPAKIPDAQRPDDPKKAARILGVFAKFWPEMQGSKTLQTEIAQQTVAIVGLACPAAAASSSAGVLEAAAERVAREWDRTLRWLRGWVGGQDASRCWRGDDLATLARLADDFDKTGGLGAYRRELSDQIAADGAAPVFGKSILAAAGWALLWAGFVVVFPYSSRVRAAYLYNERMRGLLSLWFLPAIMTLLPFLRRRMLLPFRDELLADAHLALLKDAEFYPSLRVRDREGKVQPIAKAIPDIRGKLLMIGESGLGKSTFLRVLASRSRQTIAYLNARTCDKGVEAAIMQRVSGFQSPEFFKGLIYTGDLAVIIDGLNEVRADVRAGIVAFANGAGRANLLIATQPIEGLGGDRSPLTRSTPHELLPLAREDIAKFLKSRPARDDPASVVKGEDYGRAVDRLLRRPRAKPNAQRRPYCRRDARRS